MQIAHGPGPALYLEFGDAAEYPRWITFYSALIRSLGPEERARLCAAGDGSRAPAGGTANSLPRVLGKVFHVQGSAPRSPAGSRAVVKAVG